MGFYYAQLNENRMVIGLSHLSEKVDFPNMILIDESLAIAIGWSYIDGEWLEPKIEAISPIPLEPTNAEVIQTIEDLNINLLISGVIKNV